MYFKSKNKQDRIKNNGKYTIYKELKKKKKKKKKATSPNIR